MRGKGRPCPSPAILRGVYVTLIVRVVRALGAGLVPLVAAYAADGLFSAGLGTQQKEIILVRAIPTSNAVAVVAFLLGGIFDVLMDLSTRSGRHAVIEKALAVLPTLQWWIHPYLWLNGLRFSWRWLPLKIGHRTVESHVSRVLAKF